MHVERFTSWITWSHRNELQGIRFPGIYALAISREPLTGKPFSYLPEIAYFGMTNSVSGLRGRLQQFENTINDKSGHGGADRFRHDFPRQEMLAPLLHVSVLAFQCDVRSNGHDDLLTMGRVALAEYECFAHYVSLFGSLPKYNNKREAPKRPLLQQ